MVINIIDKEKNIYFLNFLNINIDMLFLLLAKILDLSLKKI